MGVHGNILCILMLLLHKSSQEEVFNDQQTLNLPANYEIGWMETLDNKKLISTFTIPGTHDALALYGTELAECQAWSLKNQLKAGIRYFDLRVSGFGLRIMHGPIYQFTSLSKVLSTVREFLTEYKTEVVLLRVKPVFLMEGKVQNLVENMIKNDEDIWVSPSIPKLSEVRGKIVFVQKNSFKLGIILSETDKQRDYEVTKVKDKERMIEQHLEEAANQCMSQSTTGSALSLSYSSGTSLGTYMFVWLLPKKLAREINPWLYAHLAKQFEKKPCFGIIAMDFPGVDLIRRVIKFNIYKPT